jgi:uncharacterized heparinase superfamily protein
MTGEGLALLGRSAAHLRPAQVAHRARLRAQRTALQRWPDAGQRLLTGPSPVNPPRWPAAYTPLDGSALTITSPAHWPGLASLPAATPQLWRAQLHYWDWAWGLAAAPDRRGARRAFAALWRSWRQSCAFGRSDAWLPYPTALRAWSWCGLHRDLVAGSDLEAEFAAELARHAGFLRRHLESDRGGNHLVKDLKALIGLGVFLGDEPLRRRSLRLLTDQLAVQILPDGGHYERAPAYHCQVLADLIDIADLLSAAGCGSAPALTRAIARMRRWLGAVLTPDGAVPLLNDGCPVPGPLLTALRPLPGPAVPLLTLADTGLIRATAGGWHLLADVGAPCPDELPAHAHADTLGCVVHVDGAALLVDTGTSTYAAGPARDYERSTAAHNTLEIDGTDSTEVWSAFRAGRRARVHGRAVRQEPGRLSVQAAHDGYRQLPGRPVHQRRWTLTAAGLQVDDQVTGGGRHALAVRWHLAPGSAVRVGTGEAAVHTADGHFAVRVTGSAPFRLEVESGRIATGGARIATTAVLTCRMDTVLPARITADWRRAGPPATGRRR